MRQSNVCYLEITSYIGFVAGASHWFGALKFRGSSVFLQNKLSKREAIELNKRDRTALYRPGNESITFFSREQIIATAKAEYLSHFPESIALVLGSPGLSYPRQAIVGPRGYLRQANKLARDYDKLGNFEDKQMQAIEREWEKLNELFGVVP